MAKIKRIFLTGAPGSYWSRVDIFLRRCLNCYTDNTDINENRNWEGHSGVYWEPANEPGYDWILDFDSYTKEHIVETLDSVFSPIPERVDTVVRVHKSHYFAYHLDKIRELFPDDSIVLVSQPDHKCLLWWQAVGGHDIIYNSYHYYNRSYTKIWDQIVAQNTAIDMFIKKNNLEKSSVTFKLLKDNFGDLNTEFVKWMNRPGLVNHDNVDSLIALKEPGWYEKYGIGLHKDHRISIVPWC